MYIESELGGLSWLKSKPSKNNLAVYLDESCVLVHRDRELELVHFQRRAETCVVSLCIARSSG